MQSATLLLDPKYDLIGARFHASCLMSTSLGSCWSGSFRCFAWNAGFFEWTFRVTLIGFIQEQKCLQTQVLSNDQPDSYVVGKNPAINNEEISCLLVLLARVDSNEFSHTLAHKPIWCSLLSSWDRNSVEVSGIFVLQAREYFVCKVTVAYFGHLRFVSAFTDNRSIVTGG